jgi:hypothetical protein
VAPVASKIDEEHYFNENGLASKALYDLGLAQIWNPDTKCSGMKYVGTEQCGEHDVVMTVWDEKGFYDYCVVKLIISGTSCADQNEVGTIAGTIYTSGGESIDKVTVTNESQIPEYPLSRLTKGDGEYAFESNFMYYDYEVSAYKNDDVLNGVSTVDLVYILRHILGYQPLTEPSDFVAADINGDGSISAVDLIILRKTLLGIYDEFPSNSSWRFVSSDDPIEMGDMWPMTEVRKIAPLYEHMMDQNFVGVKIGDISGDSKANARQIIVKTRSQDILDLKTFLQSDGSMAIIAGDNYQEVYGFQMSMEVEGTFSGIRGEGLDIGEEDLYYHNGMLHMSYAHELGQTIEKGEVLFVLEGVKEASIIPIGLEAEAYRGTDLELMNIELDVLEVEEGVFSLGQNIPNPWRDLTVIEVNVPKDGQLQMIVRDISGKLVLTRFQQLSAGRHQIVVDNKDITQPGVYTYEVIFGDKRISKRMIRLR